RKKSALGDAWNDLMRLFRLMRAWRSGEYPGVSWRTLLLVMTAIIYFVMPFDVIPDFIAIFGFLDDATVIAFVMSKVRDELEAFTQWEEGER
ncbi:MAG: YkvA family protein, partial [Pseudomonadales bacterium]